MKKHLFTIFALLISLVVFPQEFTSKNKRAVSAVEQGQKYMQQQQFEEAGAFFRKAVEYDSLFAEAYIMLAESNLELKRDSIAVFYLKKAAMINPDYRVMTYLELAKAALNIGNYEEALWSAEKFIEKGSGNVRYLQLAKAIKEKCLFAKEALKNPVPFNPMLLGANINSEFDDYWPSLSADEQTLVFTRLIPVNALKPLSVYNRQEDFFIAFRNDTVWNTAKPLGPPINSSNNEGAQTISIDGKKMYFTACGWPGGQGRCDLYFSMMINENWIPPVNMGKPINSAFQEKQPSLSPDGRTIYFASDRPGGFGGFDIWTSQLDENNKWTEPVNLGSNVNSSYNEQSPFMHFDNQTLYFSSDGWPGMGNMDIYFSKKGNSDTSWTKCMNLGYPINTYKDEIGLIVNAKGNIAYFSSDRQGSQRRDIYSFELHKRVQPIMVTYMKGKVYNSISKEPVAANFELIDLEQSEIVTRAKASSKGEFLVCIPTNRDYALNVSATKYLFYSDNFSLSGVYDKSKPFLKDIALQPIQEGTRIILKNIFYEVNSFEIKNTSIAELTKLVEFMNNNPTLKIEVSGHTDNTGTADLNNKLSEQRARAVVDYLSQKGIAIDRLTYKGYGSSVSVADNNTEEGRAQNRRTEIKIISDGM